LQPLKHSPELELFTTRRVVVVDADRPAAEMLHMFLRLMECCLVSPASDVVPTVRRHHPDILILDLDLPDLRALEIARQIRRTARTLPIIFLTDTDPLLLPTEGPVMRKPRDRFEELLRLFELILAMP
jgi:PleD family two-component response regulator